MAEHHTGTAFGTAAGAAAAMAAEPVPEAAASGSGIQREEIARLAYQYWQERGCPDGSPEEDWFHAERELRTLTGEVAA
jgi:hypothetical protein